MLFLDKALHVQLFPNDIIKVKDHTLSKPRPVTANMFYNALSASIENTYLY